MWRFATPAELAINMLGCVCAIVAGVLEPLMTVFFGNLTNSFVVYQATLDSNPAGVEAAAQLVRDDIAKVNHLPES